MSRRSATCAAALAACATSLAAAQDPRPPHTTFRGGVELVQLDVSVLDHNRHPVRGLTASDFTVSVDGRRLPVIAFKAVDVPPPSPPAPGRAAWVREVAPDVVTNAHGAGRIVAILIDDYSFSEAAIELPGVRKAKETALAVVDALGPGDRAAVLFSGDGRTSQAFTSERALLRAAIEQAPLFGSDLTPDDSRQRGLCYCGACSIDALGRLAESLRSVPDERKIVMYISAGSIIEIPRWQNLDECIQRKRDAMHDAIRQAHIANVTIQAFDPKGLIAPRNRNAARGGNPMLPGYSAPIEQTETRRVEFLRTMAESTGGRAAVNDNDVERHVPAVLAESGSYYLLGVERPTGGREGELRRVQVRVDRGGVSVRTRSGYYDPRPDEIEAIAAVKVANDPGAAMRGAVPRTDIPLDLAVAPFATSGTQAVLAIALGVSIPPESGAPSAPDDGDDVEVLAELFNPETGQSRGRTRQQVSVAAGPSGATPHYYELFPHVSIHPGRYELRVAVRADDGRTASVYRSVEIPDFRAALAASGLVLGVEPSPRTGSSDALRKLLPVIPTARRRFTSSDRVTAFMRVYQHAAAFQPTSVTMRLVDANDAVLREHRQELDGTSVSGGSVADYQRPLDIHDLPAGEYLLTLDVEGRRTTIGRAARFRLQ